MLGVCYYPEHWPEAWWKEDAKDMASLGIRYVRIGEFSWSEVEPRRDHFTWDWLDRAVTVLGDAGLKVVMGTPTATPPKWLIDEHPDILAYDASQRPRRFGSRRHYCFSSLAYREESARITRAYADRYGNHPAVVGWQLDNEYGCHDTVVSYAPHCRPAFQAWLRTRYGTIEELNRAWGTVFWSQRYGAFAEVDLPCGTVTEANPAHRLDYQRFSSDQVAAYNRAMAGIVRERAPGRFITHNFMGFFTEFDHYPVGADLDVSSWDSYPLGFTNEQMTFLTAEDRVAYAKTGHPDAAAFHHDLYRGVVPSRRFWVMEQQPGPVNWASHNPAPAPGMIRLWTWEAIAHGAEVVSYFRWRQAPFAQEQMHAGLRRPDRAPAPASAEVERVARELAQVAPYLEGKSTPAARAEVALVFDYQAAWTLGIQPQGTSFSYMALVFRFYTALRRLGMSIDVVGPDAELSGYALVVVPSLPMADKDMVARLAASGAAVVLGPRTGSKTASFAVPDTLPPGPLSEHLPLCVAYVESLPPGYAEWITMGERRYRVTTWRERLEPASAELAAAAVFADGSGAVFARGPWHYLGFWPDEEFLRDYLGGLLRERGVATIELAATVRLRRCGELVFAWNTSAHAVKAPAPEGAIFVLGGPEIGPCDVAAWHTGA